MLRILLILLFSFAVYAMPSDSTKEVHCLNIMARAFLSLENTLSDPEKEFIKLHKNDEAFRELTSAHLTILRQNMSDQDVIETLLIEKSRTPLVKTHQVNKLIKIKKSDYTTPLDEACYHCESASPNLAEGLDSVYAKKVLSLNAGDTVEFPDGKQFELKKYIARGDMSHVFEIDDKSVLKIPFYVDEQFQHHTDQVYESIRHFQIAMSYAPEELRKVKIVSSSKYYLIMEKVNHNENGLDFINKLIDQDKVEFDTLTPIAGKLDQDETNKLEELINNSIVYHKYVSLYDENEEVDMQGVLADSRQFVFDLDRKKWILVDSD